MKVFISARIPEEVLGRITREHAVEIHDRDQPIERAGLLQGVENKDGLLCTITDRIDKEVLERAPGLRVIANNGVGFDHIDIEAASARMIPVTNTPGVLTDDTADLAFGLILSTARRIVEGDRMTRQGEFKYWAPLNFLGWKVSGKTIGIVGFGRIGQAVAKRALGFDMRVVYYSRSRLDLSKEKKLNVSYMPLNELLREADFVSLHIPMSLSTRRLIGSRELEIMKPSACLINTSRGAVVDEKALVEALQNGAIRCAGLDVYENEPELHPGLAALDNVILLPHVGSATIETRTKMASMAAENLLAGLRGERPPNIVNSEWL
jgi:glyoxylate reductase